MTRKEIIDGLKFTVDMFLFNPSTGETFTEPRNDMDKTTIDACKGAIELLEQTDGDLISREEVLEMQHELILFGHSKMIIDVSDIEQLPTYSAKADGDLISRDYVLSKFKEQCERCGKYKENNGVMCSCCALDDAIDYVEDAPNAEKTTLCTEKTTITDMDLISRTELLNKIWQKEYGKDYDGVNMLDIPHIDIIENMPSSEKTAEWISVSERLPEESLNSVIGWDAYRERCVFVQFIDGHFQITGKNESFDIQAWMPLPEPYKADKEEE